jgi:hypothetical protein
MRKLTLLLLLAGIATAALAQKEATPRRLLKRATVEQLEQLLAASHGKPDADVARQLSARELTERFSTIRLSHWDKQLPGRKSQRALVALADESAFLNLPAADIPATAAPDLAAQRRMMALTVDYINKGVQLPNFFATRITNSFQDEPGRPDRVQAESFPLRPASDQPLQFVNRDRATILYGKGWEVRSSAAPFAPNAWGLNTSVRFGPILGTAMLDAADHTLVWNHWEQGVTGPKAVFTYAVPAEKSHYLVEYCCVYGKGGEKPAPFEAFSAYHAEITVDPSNGAILRLVLRADPKPTDPFVLADVAIEYGPVKIGGKTYICPMRSIALSFGSPVRPIAADDKGVLQTMLNDVAFEKYHLFRSSQSSQVHNPQDYNWSWTMANPGP